ncbi:carbon-nitrogen hydrolase family protein [Sphingobacterium sp. WM]|uniref:carbon-nitrogen hydrolase family protein n=1 Tax=Sphingobacterium sp. WM TaxID=3031802 RepID=UPI00240E44AE|nr:carbon-nitrogen hydrolase family protein [Sphingobacterium sp. WM]WFB63849.1 carbon-nitrogen hydrolase family protein [Sphingobacterium sp. WM]
MKFPKFKAAAVQTSPVYFNVDATVAKVCAIIKEAADNGAKLIAFPEVFISAYPYWNWIMSPVEGSKWFKKLYLNSITADGPEIDKIAQTAKDYDINVVIGLNERVKEKVGTLYNTIITINNEGKVLGKHRKLVPTWAEKLTWSGGDGSSLKVHETSVGPLGALACGENTNTLARFALLAQGELIHIANYIALPVAPTDYNMAEAIKIRAAAHSFEGKVYTITSCSTISEEIIQMFEKEVPNARELLTRKNSSYSGFIDPNGQQIGESIIDDEGIVYAEIDLEKCIQPKQMHDLLGHYNRFDIFNLKVNITANNAINFADPNNSLNVQSEETDLNQGVDMTNLNSYKS